MYELGEFIEFLSWFMCVDWRKTMRSLWRVYPRTHCDLITAVANKIPLILSQKTRFIKFVSACLSTSNCIVKIITAIAIWNPMSCLGDNYRELLNGQGTLNLEPCLLSWKYYLTNLRNYMYTFKELIDIRDGIKECNGFTKAEISRFILNMCTR